MMMKRVAIGSLLALALSVGGCNPEKAPAECVLTSPDADPVPTKVNPDKIELIL